MARWWWRASDWLLRPSVSALLQLARIDPAQLTLVAALDEHPERAPGGGRFECYLPLAALVDLDIARASAAARRAGRRDRAF